MLPEEFEGPGYTHLHSKDSPTRAGYIPTPGEKRWSITLPLEDGTMLCLHIGEEVHKTLRIFMLREEVDDAMEEAAAKLDPTDEKEDKPYGPV